MNHLIAGRDYLARFKDFKLTGRDDDLERIASILMRKSSNSLIIAGPPGVGISALILGLQAAKNNPDTPFDIISKRLFWLDTDSLFASGDSNEINADFHKILKRLENTPESILIIENSYGFIEAARNTGNAHFINALNSADRKHDMQVIFEVRDDNLTQVLKSHNDIGEHYTLYDVKEPVGGILRLIVASVAEGLADFHKVLVDDSAIDEAIALTSKYRDSLGLGGAQPLRTISLLDRSLSSYRQQAHRKHPKVEALEQRLDEAKATGDATQVKEIEAELKQTRDGWHMLQAAINQAYNTQRDSSDLLFKLNDDLEEAEQQASNARDAVQTDEPASFAAAGFDNPRVAQIKSRIREVNKIIEDNRTEHARLVKVANDGLILRKRDVQNEFSKISGISADKLDADEIENLRNLEANLKSRIFGQDESVEHIANSIKVAKVDTMDESGPAASYLLLGPSGVGKTEIAKALAQYVVGDESALVRFDMSEYMEKHAVAKLIGAPPGYEGFEAGGILTNMVRKKPVGIYLFDEIEKAHPDVYNVFLQILSDGRLTDNVGRTVDFSEVIIIMTSNIGQPFYLDVTLTDEEAAEKATVELNETYRSELLNRFNGRENILHFKRLPMTVIEKIIKREITKMNNSYITRNLSIDITDETIAEFVEAHYDATRGARGLPGYIKANLRPIIVNHILDNPGVAGTFRVTFNKETSNFAVEFDG